MRCARDWGVGFARTHPQHAAARPHPRALRDEPEARTLLHEAAQRGDAAASTLLREQLAESNPILADIADAAAREADLRAAGRDASAAAAARLAGQERLQAVSARYAAAMKALKVS